MGELLGQHGAFHQQQRYSAAMFNHSFMGGSASSPATQLSEPILTAPGGGANSPMSNRKF
jgi:hypothetical protein